MAWHCKVHKFTSLISTPSDLNNSVEICSLFEVIGGILILSYSSHRNCRGFSLNTGLLVLAIVISKNDLG